MELSKIPKRTRVKIRINIQVELTQAVVASITHVEELNIHKPKFFTQRNMLSITRHEVVVELFFVDPLGDEQNLSSFAHDPLEFEERVPPRRLVLFLQFLVSL